MTGPIAFSSSPLHGPDAQTLNATHAAVSANAIANRTVGRSPDAGAWRRVRPPKRRRAGARDPGPPSEAAISSSIEDRRDDVVPPPKLASFKHRHARCKALLWR